MQDLAITSANQCKARIAYLHTIHYHPFFVIEISPKRFVISSKIIFSCLQFHRLSTRRGDSDSLRQRRAIRRTSALTLRDRARLQPNTRHTPSRSLESQTLNLRRAGDGIKALTRRCRGRQRSAAPQDRVTDTRRSRRRWSRSARWSELGDGRRYGSAASLTGTGATRNRGGRAGDYARNAPGRLLNYGAKDDWWASKDIVAIAGFVGCSCRNSASGCWDAPGWGRGRGWWWVGWWLDWG